MKKIFKIAAFTLIMSAAFVSCKKKVVEAPVETQTEIVTPKAQAPEVEVVSPVAADVVQKVADALKDYPNVKAEVINNELTITGNPTTDQARNIKMSIDALQVGKVNYNYTK